MSRREGVSQTKQRVRITPNNQPSGDTYSAQNFPAINFVIASQRAWLDPRTLRLNGEFEMINDAGDLPENNATAPGDVDRNGATLNNTIGVSSVIDEVNVSTYTGAKNLETVRTYNRYLAACKPLMHSSLDFDNGLGLQDAMCSNKSLTNARTACVKTDFSVPINVGMFDTKSYLNLSEKGFSGINIDLLLCQNAQAIQPFYYYSGSKKTDKNKKESQKTFNYKLKNLNLTYDLIIPDDRLYASLPSSGVLEYNTIASLHSTLISSDQTINLRLNANRVMSITHSIIPSLHVNNIRVDSFQLCKPKTGANLATGDGNDAEIRTVQYLRAGQLYPYNFILDSEEQANINPANQLQGDSPSPQAQIMKPYLNSVSLYNNSHNKFNPLSNIGIASGAALAGSGAQPLASSPDPRSIFGLGVCMDSNKNGVSFKSREYAIRIQSELNNTNANALFSFSRIRNVAQFSPAGINVVE